MLKTTLDDVLSKRKMFVEPHPFETNLLTMHLLPWHLMACQAGAVRCMGKGELSEKGSTGTWEQTRKEEFGAHTHTHTHTHAHIQTIWPVKRRAALGELAGRQLPVFMKRRAV